MNDDVFINYEYLLSDCLMQIAYFEYLYFTKLI